jgi:hypothetical protein
MTSFMCVLSVLAAIGAPHSTVNLNRVNLMLEPATCPTPSRVRLQLQQPPAPVQVKLRLMEVIPQTNIFNASTGALLMGGLFGPPRSSCPGGVCPPGRMVTAPSPATFGPPATFVPTKPAEIRKASTSCPCGPDCPCGDNCGCNATEGGVIVTSRAWTPQYMDRPRKVGLIKRLFGKGRCR